MFGITKATIIFGENRITEPIKQLFYEEVQKALKQRKAKSWDFNEMKLFQFNRFYTDKFFFSAKERLEEKLEDLRETSREI